jgi:Co/Zn/Cd efflux system component
VLHPIGIAYGEAIAIASLGLTVNLISAWLLRAEHHHDHDHHDHHGDDDLNLRSAYMHVLADAANLASGDYRPVTRLGIRLALR